MNNIEQMNLKLMPERYEGLKFDEEKSVWYLEINLGGVIYKHYMRNMNYLIKYEINKNKYKRNARKNMINFVRKEAREKYKNVLKFSVCNKCRTKIDLQIHHVKSIKDGGINEIENIEILCKDCHMEHHNIFQKKTNA